MLRTALVSIALAACGTSSTEPDPPDDPPEGFLVGGSLDVAGAPAGGTIVVVWEVTSGEDALIKFGEAPAKPAFMLGLAKDPPARAINSHGTAVGIVALLDAAAPVPAEGTDFDFDTLEPHILGTGDFQEVIWRGPGIDEPPAWAPGFPEGYSCGRCVLAPEGEQHDSFVPTTCDVSITTDHNICNWT